MSKRSLSDQRLPLANVAAKNPAILGQSLMLHQNLSSIDKPSILNVIYENFYWANLTSLSFKNCEARRRDCFSGSLLSTGGAYAEPRRIERFC